MAVSPGDFRIALGQFFSLEAYDTDKDNFITVITVTIEGIVGSKNTHRRNARMAYRLLASVQNLRSELPETWIVSPRDGQIDHVNIWPADQMCALTGSRLPRICWGTSEEEWLAAPAAHRTLANFLEVARQVLANANLSSPAR